MGSNIGCGRNFRVSLDLGSGREESMWICEEGGEVRYVDEVCIEGSSKNVGGSGWEFRLRVNGNYDKYIKGSYVEKIRSSYSWGEVVEGSWWDIRICGRSCRGCSISVGGKGKWWGRSFKIKFS